MTKGLSVGAGRRLKTQLAGFALCAFTLLALLASAPSARADNAYYCGTYLPAGVDCANNGIIGDFGRNWYDGYFNTNRGYIPGGSNTQQSCEHTYYYGTGTTVSRRCAYGYAPSYCDLYYAYNNGYALSAHAGNNGPNVNRIDGHAYVETEGVCS